MSRDLLFIALAAFIISNAVLVIAAARFSGLDGLTATTRRTSANGRRTSRVSSAGIEAPSTAVAVELNGSGGLPLSASISAVDHEARSAPRFRPREPGPSDTADVAVEPSAEAAVMAPSESDRGFEPEPAGKPPATEPMTDGPSVAAAPSGGPAHPGDPLPTDAAPGWRTVANDAARHRDVITLSLEPDGALDGTTVVISAPMNVPPEGELVFRYYLSDQRATVSDAAFRAFIERPDGSRSLVFEVLGGSRDVQASWLASRVSLSSWVSQTIRFVFVVTDGGPDGLVQAAIDDVRLEHPAG